MFPILKTGDWIVFSPLVEDIQPGDMILLHDPLDTNTLVIRRVIGVDFDQILIDFNHTTRVNGVSMEQKELDHNETYRFIEEIQYQGNIDRHWRITRRHDVIPKREFVSKIPENHCFVLSDNRDEYLDSRIWGSIPKNIITGKIWFRIGNKDLWQNYIVFF